MLSSIRGTRASRCAALALELSGNAEEQMHSKPLLVCSIFQQDLAVDGVW
jgi:hypothetical protein